MVSSPKVGRWVQVWYRAGVREHMPYHGRLGQVVIPSRGRPRNHAVGIDGDVVGIKSESSV
jgi:hypothetical protein